jgi:hypothetical protein
MAQHRRLYYAFVRRRVIGELVDKGKSRSEARRLARGLTETQIDQETTKVRLAKMQGPFTDWVFENRETIFAVIKAIVTILLMFAKKENDDAEGTDRARVVADSGDE